jgi:deazaflavin-dependent oxidoreductase (nitroreductase family)
VEGSAKFSEKRMTMTVKNEKSVILSVFARVLQRKGMRAVARFFTATHVLLYRLSGGLVQHPKYPTLLLTTRGRKTGKLYTIPLVYVVDGDHFIIAAGYAASSRNPAWWLNLQHMKEAVVQVKRQKIPVRAEMATVQEREGFWQRLVAMYPNFVDYQQRTHREIPVIVLQPMNSLV